MPIRCKAMDDAADFLLSQFETLFADEPVQTASFSVDSELRELQEEVYTAVRIVHTPDKTTGLRIVARYKAAQNYKRSKPLPEGLSPAQRELVYRFLDLSCALDMHALVLPTSRSLSIRLEGKRDYRPVAVPSTVELLFSLDNQPVFREIDRSA